jgi:sec-independent protein translocase protein TatA
VSIGLPEILILLLILLLIFGGSRIPQLGRALGTAVRELREHVGGRSEKEGIDLGNEPPVTHTAEAVEEEETAKRP